MSKHTVIETPGGERLVLVPLADYETLIGRLEDADEDAADVAAYDAAKAQPIEGEPRVLEAAYLEGLKVRALRKAAGLTQAEVGAGLSVSQGFIADVESGRRRFSPETMKVFVTMTDQQEPTKPRPAITPIRPRR